MWDQFYKLCWKYEISLNKIFGSIENYNSYTTYYSDLIPDVLRKNNDEAYKSIKVRAPIKIANYMLNEKRERISAIENRYKLKMKIDINKRPRERKQSSSRSSQNLVLTQDHADSSKRCWGRPWAFFTPKVFQLLKSTSTEAEGFASVTDNTTNINVKKDKFENILKYIDMSDE